MNSLQDMLRDIQLEVEMTRRYIGKDALDARVIDAMAQVPREQFLPEETRFLAFQNGPAAIGHGQTISQPYIVALMTDLLEIGPESTVLEVGTGSGYQAAVLSHLAKQVYSLEIIAPLAQLARERLQRLGHANVEVRHGDGYEGWAEHAPYDGIIVTAAAPPCSPAPRRPIEARRQPGHPGRSGRLAPGTPGSAQGRRRQDRHPGCIRGCLRTAHRQALRRGLA
jgi:protein-L-isoaspartate(D-aspartate) O-methyltransferase